MGSGGIYGGIYGVRLTFLLFPQKVYGVNLSAIPSANDRKSILIPRFPPSLQFCHDMKIKKPRNQHSADMSGFVYAAVETP